MAEREEPQKDSIDTKRSMQSDKLVGGISEVQEYSVPVSEVNLVSESMPIGEVKPPPDQPAPSKPTANQKPPANKK